MKHTDNIEWHCMVWGGLGMLAACSGGGSNERLAHRIGELSDGRLEIEVFAAGESIPAFEVLDSVSRGQMDIGHRSPTYSRGILLAAHIFSSVPIGLGPVEHKTWMYHDGGLDLRREVYGERGIVPLMARNTGA